MGHTGVGDLAGPWTVEKGTFSGQPLTLDLSFPVCKVDVGDLVALSPRLQAEVSSPLAILSDLAGLIRGLHKHPQPSRQSYYSLVALCYH